MKRWPLVLTITLLLAALHINYLAASRPTLLAMPAVLSPSQDEQLDFAALEKKATKTSSGLKYLDLVVGQGDSPTRGKILIIRYTVRLKNGKVADSSPEEEDFRFRLGLRQVIKGVEEGVMTMKVGGKRRLIIPPLLGYGDNGTNNIPPGATIIFDVELLGIEL